MTTLADLWTSRYKDHPNMDNCRVGVWESGSWWPHQCNRKVSVFRCVEGQSIGFCKQHDPEAVALRMAKRDAKWKAECDARNALDERKSREAAAFAACREAMRRIAEGHNDPRALAAETLALFP